MLEYRGFYIWKVSATQQPYKRGKTENNLTDSWLACKITGIANESFVGNSAAECKKFVDDFLGGRGDES